MPSSINPFPAADGPRVWLLTSGATPLALNLTRKLLAHGDYVAAGISAEDVENKSESTLEFVQLAKECLDEDSAIHGPGKLQAITLECRTAGQCQAAVAKVIDMWGRLDVLLCCTSQAIVGTVEELSQNEPARSLIRDQFDVNYFGMVNIIMAALPILREQGHGHFIILTGVTGHIGTPGLGLYCASGWALEGFCDSLTFEVAAFNIKVTIVQPNLEVNVLTNKIFFAAPMTEYSEDEDDGGPKIRDIFKDTIARADPKFERHSSTANNGIEAVYPPLREQSIIELVEETAHTLISIGGHTNPPARHIVGNEGVIAVKEKLKTVSEELEEFAEIGLAIDIHYKQSKTND